MPEVALHGGCRTTSTAMINQSKKSHWAENLSSFSHSAVCASTAAMHHTTMMYQTGWRKEATNLAWRLPRQGLGSQPPWLVSVCLLANLPSKKTPTTTQQRLSTCCDQNGQQRPPWCPTSNAGTYNSCPGCWLIVICCSARSEAPWRPWGDGGRH